MGFTVRSIESLEDVQGVLRIHDSTWEKSSGILDLLRNSKECYVVADEDEEIHAYAFIQVDAPAGGFAELDDIAVSPECRGQGVGHLLMRHIMDEFGWIKLLASAAKPQLLRFYKEMGFQQEAIFENYYGIDEDAVRFVWKGDECKAEPVTDRNE